MLSVHDPLNRFAFDLHQYLDADFSGRVAECPAASRAVEAIDSVSSWLASNERRGFLGEFAASERPECLAALKSIVSHVNAHPKEWVGWTAWGAGAWWPPNYIFSLQPTTSGERPQMKTLISFFQKPDRKSETCDLSERK
jgi:endoglucanase